MRYFSYIVTFCLCHTLCFANVNDLGLLENLEDDDAMQIQECKNPQNIEDFIKSSDEVFSGRVSKKHAVSPNGEYCATISAQKIWKGNVYVVEKTVCSSMLKSECGFTFDLGQYYLVFAKKYGKVGALKVNRCFGTKVLLDVSEDIKKIENYFAKKKIDNNNF